LVQAFLKKWGLNQILRRQTSRSHYGSKVPAVTITVFKYRNKTGKIVVTAVTNPVKQMSKTLTTTGNFEDIKGIIRKPNSKETDNEMTKRKRTNRITMADKMLHKTIIQIEHI
jgi:hypothetical protein